MNVSIPLVPVIFEHALDVIWQGHVNFRYGNSFGVTLKAPIIAVADILIFLKSFRRKLVGISCEFNMIHMKCLLIFSEK